MSSFRWEPGCPCCSDEPTTDICLRKYGGGGSSTQSWVFRRERLFGGVRTLRAVDVDSSGNVVTGGDREGTTLYAVHFLNSSGVEQWGVGGTSYIDVHAVRFSPDEASVFVAYHSGDSKVKLAKLSASDGSETWSVEISANTAFTITGMDVESGGDVFIAGGDSSNNSIIHRRSGTDGSSVWTALKNDTVFPAPPNDGPVSRFYDVRVAPSEACIWISADTPNGNPILWRADLDGEYLSSYRPGSTGNYQGAGFAVDVMSDDEVVVAGGGIDNNNLYQLIKVTRSDSGDPLDPDDYTLNWGVAKADTSPNNRDVEFHGVAVDSSDNVYCAGLHALNNYDSGNDTHWAFTSAGSESWGLDHGANLRDCAVTSGGESHVCGDGSSLSTAT